MSTNAGHLLLVEQDILSKNNHLARHNQAYFDEKKILALNVMSSPGSGKTTLLAKTIADLGEHYKVVMLFVTEGENKPLKYPHMLIRRDRGYVPSPIQLPYAIPPTLALGGHLKNTFCIPRGDEAFVSSQMGHLNHKATIDDFHASMTHWLRFLNVKPACIAHDQHPDFYTTRCAEGLGLPGFPVQHHHAHLDAVSALLGVCTVSQYEGQAAMQLESLVTGPGCIPNDAGISLGQAWVAGNQFFTSRCGNLAQKDLRFV